MTSCTPRNDSATSSEDVIEVFTGIPPTAYFVEKIGGERVHVNILVQPGQSPHSFEPSPRQVTDLGNAKLFFTSGMPFEEQLSAKISGIYKNLTIIPIDKGVKHRIMTGSHHHEEPNDHGKHNGDEAEDVNALHDPHIWLAPQLIIVQAQNIAAALTDLDRRHAALYETNLQQFISEVKQVDSTISEALAPFKGRSFYVFHPSFGYFGDAYGLVQEAVEIEGKSPTLKQMHNLIHQATEDSVRIIFVQPQFDRRSAEIIAEAIQGVVVPIDPLAEDVLRNLSEIAGKIENALKR